MALGPEMGAKAANLARARAAGLPVVDGFVLAPDVACTAARASRSTPGPVVDAIRAAWAALSRHGSDPVVVRSSSSAEDTESSSQAGVFESVVDVRGWDALLDAVATVVRSAKRAAQPGSTTEPAPIAVLVQRHVDPDRGGVMFGVDPVSGRADRLVIATVYGGPQRLVGGEEGGDRVVLDRSGHLAEGRRGSAALRRRDRVGLARLAREVESLFGGPQDVEWAITTDGALLLLQSRPVTAVAAVGVGPVLGPGPVAETFPDPLRPLELDLWLTPLRDALRVALRLTGRASRRMLDRSPVATAVDGRPAVDLDLFESGTRRRRGWALLDPRQPARRLAVAWRVGRLRAGLPTLAEGLVADIDLELDAVPALQDLGDDELLGLLDRTREALRAAHGYEILAGVLAAGGGPTGAEVALGALAGAREQGGGDAEIVADAPVVLALVPPRVGPPAPLPTASAWDVGDVGELGPREALRLRIRWLHELSARAAWELGARLAARGALAEAGDVAYLRLGTIEAVVRGGLPANPEVPSTTIPPLPARFRLSRDGGVVALPAEDAAGVGAGGGRGVGRVDQGREPLPGAVLVVATLDPRLAPVLPLLAGLVSETGSPLSHLAILAREHGVPTVVGVSDARRRFPPGATVLLDGRTGEVRSVTSNDAVSEEVGR